jgi:hypothetical protein
MFERRNTWWAYCLNLKFKAKVEAAGNGAYPISPFEIDETRGENRCVHYDSFREEFVKNEKINILRFQLKNIFALYLELNKEVANA